MSEHVFSAEMEQAFVKKLNDLNKKKETPNNPLNDLISRLVKAINIERKLDNKYRGQDEYRCPTYGFGYWFYSPSLEYIVPVKTFTRPNDFMGVDDWILIARTKDGTIIPDANTTGGAVPL